MEKEEKSDVGIAFKLSLPVLIGYVPLGIVFGFLFVQAGGAWWIPPIASIMIYGGAVQYMMIPMLATGLPIAAIGIATLTVNLRHVFYGISILHKVPSHGWKKWAVAFLLTDETYSLLCSLPVGTPIRRILWLAFFDWCWWITGSFIGAVLGSQIPTQLAGLDFVLCSLFAMLLCEQWRARTSSLPLWTALISYVMAYAISKDNALALSMAFCFAVACIYFLGQPLFTKHKNQERK
ncbi:MAG: AzlC family ABC transporter permease [Burkholderiales bacterium]|nr:AzlC family ABC transporter permease [Burkholderiales bacterium]